MQFSRKKGEVVKIERSGISKFLGDLEADVMEVVWGSGEATVKRVLGVLEAKGKKLAYTTVLTVMQNLEKKGLLQSQRVDKKNLYFPTISKEEFLDKMVGDALESLIRDFPEHVVSHLLPKESLGEEELKRLANLLREKAKR